MAEEGTWAWLEIGDSTLLAAPSAKEIVVSAFANRQLFLAVANYGRTIVEISTTDAYVLADTPVATPSKTWTLSPRSLEILRRVG